MKCANTRNTKMDELKKTIKLYEVIKLEHPIDIKVRQFNLQTGRADTVIDVAVSFASKLPCGDGPEEFLNGQMVVVYGTKKYSSGDQYTGSANLKYTDSGELQKVIDAVRKGTSRPDNIYFKSLRGY